MDERFSRLSSYAPLGTVLPRWQKSSVAVIGCGGLGAGLIAQLARFGVQRLILIDRDIVGWENLGHQGLFIEEHARLGLPKAAAAAEAVSRVNSQVEVRAEVASLDYRNIQQILDAAELLFDGLDSYVARFLVNDYALASGKPFFYAGVVGGSLSAQAVIPGATRCLRCLLGRPPTPGSVPACSTAGVFPPLLGMANLLQLHAANRYLAGDVSAELGSLYSFDMADGRLQRLAGNPPRADCPSCRGRYDYLSGIAAVEATAGCAPGVAELQLNTALLNLPKLEEALKASGRFQLRRNEWCLTAEQGQLRFTVFSSGRLLLHGAQSPEQLQAFAVTYIGI